MSPASARLMARRIAAKALAKTALKTSGIPLFLRMRISKASTVMISVFPGM
jgi:hypothetical protein